MVADLIQFFQTLASIQRLGAFKRFMLAIVLVVVHGFSAWSQDVQPETWLTPVELQEPALQVGETMPGDAIDTELRQYKRQALQSVSVSGGVLAELGSGGINRHFTEVSIGSGIPLGSFENILGVQPAFRVDWVEAPETIDIASELYQFELLLFYRQQLRPRLSGMAIVTPSIRSDLTTGDDALRFFALGLLTWDYIPDRLSLSGGVVWLGRADLPLLPAVGLSWTPDRYSRLDLQFPRSRWSQCWYRDPGQSEIWTYVAAGIGGNTWAVTRDSGNSDELSLSDYRVTVGIERLLDGGGRCFLETGMTFGRELEYEQDATQLELGNAFYLSGGWKY